MTEYVTVWIVELRTECRAGQWFVRGVAPHAPEKDRMVERLVENGSIIEIFAKIIVRPLIL